MFHSYFDRKNIKVLTFNIVHFPNFEINASLGGGGGGAYETSNYRNPIRKFAKSQFTEPIKWKAPSLAQTLIECN